MNLYLITRTDAVGWDEYDSELVAADNEDAAYSLSVFAIDPDDKYNDSQRPMDQLNIKLIGVASRSIKAGSIISSFNAG